MELSSFSSIDSFVESLGSRPVRSFDSSYGPLGELLVGAVETNVSKRPLKKIVPYSYYDMPIDRTAPLHGYSRNWGDASTATQTQVMKKIMDAAGSLSTEDQAILLGVARIESGFNPDAAATTSSAAGVFQFVANTGKSFGLSKDTVFNADANIAAGIELFKENSDIISARYPNLTADERAVKLYAIHHDGPGLGSRGSQIAREKLLPTLEKFRSITRGYER